MLQIVALAFLILATITAPATPALKLGHEGEYSFGVLGFCKDGDGCTTSLGYDLNSLLNGAKSVLKGDSLNSLTKVLVVAPISAFFTLLSVILNIIAHISSSMSRSGAFWVVMMILGILAFAGSAITCIISFLLFYPRVDWPTWCLIPSAILNMIALVMFGFAWRLLPEEDENRDILLSEADEKNGYTFNVRDDSSYPDETSLTFNPPPIRTQLNIYGNASDLESNAKKSSEAYVKSNELSEGHSLESSNNIALNSETSSTQQFGSVSANGEMMETKSNSSDLKLPSLTNPYLDSTNSHTVDSRLSINESLNDGHIRSGSGNSSDSNFTSISQRGVNPQYYAGAPNKPNMPIMNPQNIPPPPQQQRFYPNGAPMPPPQHHMMMMPPQQQPRGYNGGPPLRSNNYQNVPMPNQPYNRGAYMQKPKPYMAMNGNRPSPGGGFPPPQNPYGYYGGPPNVALRGQPQMNGYQQPGGYKNRSRPNLPAASQTMKGPYGMY